ncbi:hypothetical protein [Sinomicrobium sp. M5D2P17]
MSFQIRYKTLFRVFLYHNYHLNDGTDEFNAMNNEEKDIRLKDYDHRAFLGITPTGDTSRFLAGHNLVFRSRKDHFSIGVKTDPDNEQQPFIPIDTTASLTFLIRIKDPYFMNYTRYTAEKDRVLYLTNVKPATEGMDFAYIPGFAENVFIDENHILSEDGTRDFLGELKDREKIGISGCIKLHMQGDSPDDNILENTGDLPAIVPRFKIHFDNRKTFWKYLKPSEGFEAETQAEKPLTKNGFIEIDPDTDFAAPPPGAGTYRYPNPSVYSIKTVANKTYSEIFI